jgi:hypothetical protein
MPDPKPGKSTSPRLCACGCGEEIPESVLSRARMLGKEDIVRYTSPVHRERANKRATRARKKAKKTSE